MGTKIVTKEYPAYPGSMVYTKKDFVGVDAEGMPILEDVTLLDCPDCGAVLKVVQHAGTADGLPHVTCGRECPGGAPLVVIDYDTP